MKLTIAEVIHLGITDQVDPVTEIDVEVVEAEDGFSRRGTLADIITGGAPYPPVVIAGIYSSIYSSEGHPEPTSNGKPRGRKAEAVK